MPPFVPHVLRSIASGAAESSQEIKSQWQSPSNILSVLLIVAGNIVGEALDQLSGPGVAPIVFSFGWVAYAVQAFMSAIGVHKLISPPSKASPSSRAINIDTGFSCKNRSWTLERIMRDFEYWKPEEAKNADKKSQKEQDEKRKDGRKTTSGTRKKPLFHNNDGEDDDSSDTEEIPLRIYLFAASHARAAGHPTKDRLWYSGIGIALIQLGIAAVPCGLYGQWASLMVTGVGTILAFTTGALPQFGKEKWDCKRRSKKTIALTRKVRAGGGGRDVIVIRGAGRGLDLEDLAQGGRWENQTLWRSKIGCPTVWPWTRSATGLLAACWIVLLITAAGIRGNSWYLIGIGTLGLAQNAFVAGAPRTPDAQGLHLDYEGAIKEDRVEETLERSEESCKGLGKALRKILYPELTDGQLARA